MSTKISLHGTKARKKTEKFQKQRDDLSVLSRVANPSDISKSNELSPLSLSEHLTKTHTHSALSSFTVIEGQLKALQEDYLLKLACCVNKHSKLREPS